MDSKMTTEDTKIQQLFEDVSVLPDISLRPDSAARSSRVTSANLSTSASGASSSSLGSASGAGVRRKTEGPYTPQEALERFRRQLTPYEQTEILDYPQVYFVAPLARKIQAAEGKGPNFGFDDEKGRYKCVKNDHISYRYEILKGLGKGSFGDVVKTYDHKTKTHQAVKIIRNERRFHKQGQIEVKILEALKKQDKRGNHNLIHINDWFLFRNHLCITFDLMYQDLYSALKKDGFKGFTLKQVQSFTVSLLSCLRLLRRNRIIHCDLKPENILLTSKDSDEIKVIDFGSACYDHEKIHSYIQSRFYRAPEVILGAGYSVAIDMWSLGCILAELYTGQPLFPGRDEKEQLMYQMEVLGLPKAEFLESSKRKTSFFDPSGEPLFTVDQKGVKHTVGSRPLSKVLGSKDAAFLDFVTRCLQWDPADRMTPREATRHPWVADSEEMQAAASSSPTPGQAPSASVPAAPAGVPLNPPTSATVAGSAYGGTAAGGPFSGPRSFFSSSKPSTHSISEGLVSAMISAMPSVPVAHTVAVPASRRRDSGTTDDLAARLSSARITSAATAGRKDSKGEV